MKTITFIKTVPIETTIDKDFRLEINEYYNEILLSIDEIEQWGLDRIVQDKNNGINSLKIIYNVVYREA